MKELSRATGLPRSTLLHYTAEGLLPSPLRTSRNMAWYDPACVDRVKLVRQLQQHHRLALHEIRALLQSADPAALAGRLAVNEAVFGADAAAAPALDLAAFCAGTGLDAAAVASLAREGLLAPLEEGRFDPADLAAGRAYARALGWGLTPADLAFYARAAALVVDAEVALRARLTAALPAADAAARTLEMLGNARALRTYVVERAFQRRVAAMKRFQEGEASAPGRPRRRSP
jgi:DNA-binding transcriptional MerR regulator